MRSVILAIATSFLSGIIAPAVRAGTIAADRVSPGSEARLQLLLLTAALVAGCALLLALTGTIVSLRRRYAEAHRTNQRLSESNARLAAALRARSELLATSSHEIRTPLNGILGMTQVMLADHRIGAEVKERIEILHGAGETMRALVDEILDRARIENGSPEIGLAPFDPAHLIDEAVRFWRTPAETKGLGYAIDVAPLPACLLGDEARLRQILFNLLSNAVKYTPTGSVGLSARMEEDRLVIVVTDTGIGIPVDEQAAIFERFHRVGGEPAREIGGTGLGLAICRQLATAMGGSISVQSTEGRGSAFRIDMPMRTMEAPIETDMRIAAKGTPDTGAEASGVLVVGLNPLVQRIIAKALEDQGMTVRFVDSAEAACACIAGGGIGRVLFHADPFLEDPDPLIAIGQVTACARAAGLFLMLLYTPSSGLTAEDLAALDVGALVAKPVAVKDIVARLGLKFREPA
ncbi:hybrid sensor histidine kinase/response regulator [Sphingomonas sp. AP4-R1]|uniref:sensor histidine kinase n=1 Tax=Sphingomonas sp. AP4-R1 TaxID=2735134 RepID=UPI001493325D|nr:ATP-binding protein [Sphingomonas sp. AP4-R1]QJU59711.1 hybrid sensor histidine kinase/response regulator [Sphingomonas sp. AP4-R1]